MTPLQIQRAKAKAKREKELARKRTKREKDKLLRAARALRQKLRVEKRKAKRAEKAAPRNRLAAWGAEVRKCGKCAVCGVGPTPKVNKDGTPKLDKRGNQIIVPLNAHHILPKEKYPQYKFEFINGLALCPAHHKYSARSAHRHPLWFTLFLRKHRPEQYRWAKARILEEGPI